MSHLLNENSNNKYVVTKARGKHIFINNKKYLDLTYAAGSLLLGHTSSVYTKALTKLKKIGSNYAASNIFVENFALTLKKIFPKYSKFIICASGTEANMKAIRLSRAVTEKKIVAMVSGSWHGSVDELLFIKTKKNSSKKKMLSSGLYSNKDTIMLNYNDLEQSKKIINKFKKKIAILIIEPIQQAVPTLTSEKYVKEIYKICKKNNILICFDEMVTGLRCPKFSVFNKLKITPDLITFGKIFGGGSPIGIIGITRSLENKLINKNQQVFFGGTYAFNPLSSFIGLNTVKYILKNKDKIYPKLEFLSKLLTDNLNKFINEKKLNLNVIRYESMIRIIYSNKIITDRYERDFEEKKNIFKINKFKKYVFTKKIFLSKNGAIFLSYRNTHKDINFILKVFKEGFIKYFK